MIHIPAGQSRAAHHDTQNDAWFKTCELSISGIFRLIFLDHGCLWVTETVERETADKGGPLCFPPRCEAGAFHQKSSVLYSTRGFWKSSHLCPQDLPSPSTLRFLLNRFPLKLGPQFCLILLPFGCCPLHITPLSLREPASCSELT